MPATLTRPSHRLPRRLAGWLCIALLAALPASLGCQESLGIDEVTWLCASDADCGANYRCSGASGVPKFTCVPTSGSVPDAGGGDASGGDASGGDVSNATRDCANFCSALASLETCEGLTLDQTTTCDTKCKGLTQGCFECIQSTGCDGVISCITGPCLLDLCLTGGFCNGGSGFPGFP
ncbi:MAG: hypothetical protein R3F39_11545 [Myxococcota bacterium]